MVVGLFDASSPWPRSVGFNLTRKKISGRAPWAWRGETNGRGATTQDKEVLASPPLLHMASASLTSLLLPPASGPLLRSPDRRVRRQAAIKCKAKDAGSSSGGGAGSRDRGRGGRPALVPGDRSLPVHAEDHGLRAAAGSRRVVRGGGGGELPGGGGHRGVVALHQGQDRVGTARGAVRPLGGR
ncbi:unnamed protein product [Musa textilis]